MANEDRIYLICPFEERNACKALGAKWDNEQRKWYVQKGSNLEQFYRWLPHEPMSEYPDLVTDNDTIANKRNAVKKWKPLAEEGKADAQFHLGRIYEDGFGVRQNRGEAAKWFRRSAEQGYVLAQSALGEIYDEGLGVKKSSKKAAYWYELAAHQGDLTSQLNLGVMCCKGEEIPEDIKQGMKWLRLAAMQNCQRAQINLGLMYKIEGEAPLDYIRSYMWYTIAAASDDDESANEEAIERRKSVAGIMTPNQIIQAQVMADSFLNRTDQSVKSTNNVVRIGKRLASI